MKCLIYPCERPMESRGVTYVINLPMRLQKSEVVELDFIKETKPSLVWGDEDVWIYSDLWQVDQIVHVKTEKGKYQMKIYVSPSK